MGQIKRNTNYYVLDDKWSLIDMAMSHYFFNLEARQKYKKKRSFFGSNENFEICFWDLLTKG